MLTLVSNTPYHPFKARINISATEEIPLVNSATTSRIESGRLQCVNIRRTMLYAGIALVALAALGVFVSYMGSNNVVKPEICSNIPDLKEIMPHIKLLETTKSKITDLLCGSWWVTNAEIKLGMTALRQMGVTFANEMVKTILGVRYDPNPSNRDGVPAMLYNLLSQSVIATQYTDPHWFDIENYAITAWAGDNFINNETRLTGFYTALKILCNRMQIEPEFANCLKYNCRVPEGIADLIGNVRFFL